MSHARKENFVKFISEQRNQFVDRMEKHTAILVTCLIIIANSIKKSPRSVMVLVEVINRQ